MLHSRYLYNCEAFIRKNNLFYFAATAALVLSGRASPQLVLVVTTSDNHPTYA